MSSPTKAPLSLAIAVVGAGVGGLAAAHCLARSGHRVTVYESARQLGEVGAGIHLSPNVTRLMIRWGLGQRLSDVCVVMKRFSLYSWQTAERLTTISFSAHDAPYYAIHRADLHALVHDLAAPNVEIRLDSKVVEVDASAPTLTLQTGEVIHVDLIIGADGVKSAVREAVIGRPAPPIPTGDAAYRTTIPAELLRADPELAELFDQDETSAWVGPGRHVIGYPIRAKKEYNLLLLHPDNGSSDSWTKVSGNIEHMQEDFKGWEPRLQKLMTMVKTLMNWTLIDIDPLDTWVHKDGKAALLGDAAHAMLPYRAQGAAMAMEDAAVLGDLFSYVTTPAQIKPLLEAYNEIRNARASATQTDSRGNQTTMHLPDGPAQIARDAGMRAAQKVREEGIKAAANLEGEAAELKKMNDRMWSNADSNMIQYGYDADAEVEKWWQEKGRSLLASV